MSDKTDFLPATVDVHRFGDLKYVSLQDFALFNKTYQERITRITDQLSLASSVIDAKSINEAMLERQLAASEQKLSSCEYERNKYASEVMELENNFNDAAIVGFVYTYMCIEADKGKDVRQIELPRIFEAWKQSLRVQP